MFVRTSSCGEELFFCVWVCDGWVGVKRRSISWFFRSLQILTEEASGWGVKRRNRS